MTFISRVLGLVRDSAIAAVFGATAATDAFFVAFKIPNLFRRLFAEGAFSQAFVPVLAGYRTGQSAQAVRELLDAVAGVLAGILLAVTAVGVLAAPLIIGLVAPGFVDDTARFDLSVQLLRLTFPYLFFVSLTAFLGGVLNTWERFAVPAVTPALLNVALIACTLWLAPRLDAPIFALAVGVLLGGLLQLGLQLAAAARAGILPRPRWQWRHPGVQRILLLMVPGIFGVSVAQLNFLVDTLIASFLQEGSISWLYFADRLMEFPVGIFGVALGTVILPSLSRRHASRDLAGFSRTLDWGLRMVVLITLPAAAGLAVLAQPILATLFHYGRMSAVDVAMSANALMAYAFGLTGFILVKVLAPGFFSQEDTRTPVKAGVAALLTNLVLNLILVWPLQHAGLALATSLAAFVNAGLLWVMLVRKGSYRPEPGWTAFLLRVGLATAGMALALALAQAPAEIWLARSIWARVFHLTLLILAGMGVYAVLAIAAGLRRAHVAQPDAAL
jgi:putative peptidoglycan lipid II flippase